LLSSALGLCSTAAKLALLLLVLLRTWSLSSKAWTPLLLLLLLVVEEGCQQLMLLLLGQLGTAVGQDPQGCKT
jgi:hypothetical protein